MIFKKDKVKNALLINALRITCGIYQKIRRFREHQKFIMANFYEMDFMKGIVILVNVDEMCKILKSLLANRFWSRDKGGIG